MAKTSSFDDRRSRVSFDRVELARSPLGDRAFELSQGVELVGTELQSVTWVYDIDRDSVIWSSPIERFFGFEEGVRGFSVVPDPAAALNGAGGPGRRRSDHRDPSGPSSRFAGGAESGDALLAPILTPIRRGSPPAEFDLHMVVNCPDGVAHNVVVRASP